jgi:hypothetical protein
MKNPKTITITADKTICYERVVKSTLEIAEDFLLYEDLLELLKVAQEIDRKLQNTR